MSLPKNACPPPSRPHAFDHSCTHHRCPAVRRNTCPPLNAGVLLLGSPSGFVASSLNADASAAKTYVVPFWLVTYSRSPTCTMLPQNFSPRICSFHTSLP